MKRLVLFALAAFAIFALPATAARPEPYLVVTPNPVVQNNVYAVNGCGFRSGRQVVITIHSNANITDQLLQYTRISDGGGCIAEGTLGAVTAAAGFPYPPYFQLGDVLVTAAYSNKPNAVVASTTFTITA
jgi:hypothetical protein